MHHPRDDPDDQERGGHDGQQPSYRLHRPSVPQRPAHLPDSPVADDAWQCRFPRRCGRRRHLRRFDGPRDDPQCQRPGPVIDLSIRLVRADHHPAQPAAHRRDGLAAGGVLHPGHRGDPVPADRQPEAAEKRRRKQFEMDAVIARRVTRPDGADASRTSGRSGWTGRDAHPDPDRDADGRRQQRAPARRLRGVAWPRWPPRSTRPRRTSTSSSTSCPSTTTTAALLRRPRGGRRARGDGAGAARPLGLLALSRLQGDARTARPRWASTGS